jgi:hypothetical protein
MNELKLVTDNLSIEKQQESFSLVNEYAQFLFDELENCDPRDLSSVNKKVLQFKTIILEDEQWGNYQKISKYCQHLLEPTRKLFSRQHIEDNIHRLCFLLEELQYNRISAEELIKDFKEIDPPLCWPKFKRESDAFFDVAGKVELLLFVKCEEAVPSFHAIFQEKLEPLKKVFDEKVDALCAAMTQFQSKRGDALSKEERVEIKYLITKMQRLLESNKRIVSFFPVSSALDQLKSLADDYSPILEKTLSMKERVESELLFLHALLQEWKEIRPFEWLIQEFEAVHFPPPDPAFEEEREAFFCAVQEIETTLAQKASSLKSFQQAFQKKLLPMKEAFERKADILYAQITNVPKNFHKRSKEERAEVKGIVQKIQTLLDENKELLSRFPSFLALKKIQEFKDSYGFYQFSVHPFSAEDEEPEWGNLPHHIGGEGLKFLRPVQQIMLGETFGHQYHRSAICSAVDELHRGEPAEKLGFSKDNLAFLLQRINDYNKRLTIEKSSAKKQNKLVSSELPIQLHKLNLTGYRPEEVNFVLKLCPGLKTLTYHIADMTQINLSLCPDLLEVDLSYVYNLSVEHLQALSKVTSLTLLDVKLPAKADFSTMPCLIVLNLRNCYSSLSEQEVAKIIDSITDTVEELNLQGLFLSLADLLKFKRLHTLWIGRVYCSFIGLLNRTYFPLSGQIPSSIKHLHLGAFEDYTPIKLKDLALESLSWIEGSKLDIEQMYQIQELKELHIKHIDFCPVTVAVKNIKFLKCRSLTKLILEGNVHIEPQPLPSQIQHIVCLSRPTTIVHVINDLDLFACENLKSVVLNGLSAASPSKIEWLLQHSESVELLNVIDLEDVDFSCIERGSKLKTLILDSVDLTEKQREQLEQIQKQFGSAIAIEIRNNYRMN